ncbi:MAG: alkyl hydroperoxide reductase [Planctomycetota bacterium]
MAEAVMPNLEALRQTLPDPARDTKLNIASVLGGEILSSEQIWGVAMASAYFLRDARLLAAVLADAKENGIRAEMMEDAQAAASLMAMNTVYYRFRHMVEKPTYQTRQAQLRMQWMAKPKTSKVEFELLCMACAFSPAAKCAFNPTKRAFSKGSPRPFATPFGSLRS